MSKIFSIIIFTSFVLAARAEETNVVAAATNAAPRWDSFEAFKIVAQRSIFDPNRAAPGVRRERREEPKPVRTDYLNLLGAMAYEKGEFAFFDGTSSEYRKSVKAGDSIAGCKVTAVTQAKVTLECGDQTIELPVGGQLKRQEGAEWKLNANAETFSSSSAGPASPSSSTTSSAPKTDSSSGGPSEALKRLMERRRQEK